MQSKMAEEYGIEAHDTSTSLINRSDLPADVEIATTFGLIFNYLGRRSICKMYVVDCVEKDDNKEIENFIGKEPFKALNTYGWLAEDHIKLIDEFYVKMIVLKTQEYSL